MTISTEQIYLLNRMNAVAAKCQLGTLIANAESVVAAEIALANGTILMGNGSGIAAAVTPSGDATISNTGVVAIASGVIVNADVSGSAAVAFSKLAALPDGQIIVGSGATVPTAVAVSGDATLSNTGALTLAGFTHTTEGLSKLEKVAVVIYSFAVDGGAQSTIASGVTLPDNVVVTKVIEDVVTHLTSAGSSATVKLTLPTDGDLSSNVTADGSNAGVASVLPSGTPVKTSAAREVGIVIGTEAVTAGTARWFIYYVQSI